MGPVSAQTLEKERLLKEQLQNALEKAKKEAAEANAGGASSSTKPAGPMQSMPLIGQLDEALEKAKSSEEVHFCVDWHNTLEKDEDVSAENLAALTCLLQVGKVHLLSYVQSSKRESKVLKDMKSLPQYALLASTNTCWRQVGVDGKVDWACHLGCTVIFDDQPQIIKEAKKWGLHAFGIQHPKAPKERGHIWDSFADAVLDYLESLIQ